jgi:hypothetical protein
MLITALPKLVLGTDIRRLECEDPEKTLHFERSIWRRILRDLGKGVPNLCKYAWDERVQGETLLLRKPHVCGIIDMTESADQSIKKAFESVS